MEDCRVRNQTLRRNALGILNTHKFKACGCFFWFVVGIGYCARLCSLRLTLFPSARHGAYSHFGIWTAAEAESRPSKSGTIGDCLGLANDVWKFIFKDNRLTKTNNCDSNTALRRQVCRGATRWTKPLYTKKKKRLKINRFAFVVDRGLATTPAHARSA